MVITEYIYLIDLFGLIFCKDVKLRDKAFNMQKCIWYMVHSCMFYACKQTQKQIDLLGAICSADIEHQKYVQHHHMKSNTT